jgi:hypothetical protein
MESKCPNCQVRPAAIDVDYDEILSATFRSEASSRGRRTRSFSGTATYGHTRLCAHCAADYQRMVRLRTTGRRIANYGFAGLVVGAVIFGIGAAAVPGLSTSVAGLLLALPMALALLAVLVGSALFFAALARRRSATRFIGRASA